MARPHSAIARIREFAREQVARTSLRAVADDIGVSFSGLHSFLGGREPYSATRRKLTAWYVVAGNARRAVSVDQVDESVAVLAYYLATETRRDAKERKLRAMISRVVREAAAITHARQPGAEDSADLVELAKNFEYPRRTSRPARQRVRRRG